MKLYYLNSNNVQYYTSAVVAALDESAARLTHPLEGVIWNATAETWEFLNGEPTDKTITDWPRPEHVSLTYLTIADDNTLTGVVVAHYTPGPPITTPPVSELSPDMKLWHIDSTNATGFTDFVACAKTADEARHFHPLHPEIQFNESAGRWEYAISGLPSNDGNYWPQPFSDQLTVIYLSKALKETPEGSVAYHHNVQTENPDYSNPTFGQF